MSEILETVARWILTAAVFAGPPVAMVASRWISGESAE